MTNFEKFKLMNIEELSEWLTQYGQFENSPWINWWNETYCKNCDTEITYVINPKTGIKSDKPSECTWCEIHNKCRYFQELDEVPDIKEMIKMWLENNVGTDMEDNATDEDKIINDSCEYCSDDYDQEIIVEVMRYNSSREESYYPIRAIYCPNCGRKLS